MLSTIGIVIDIVIVAALVIFAIIGFSKGFLKSVISLFSWVVCVGVAVLVAKYVAGWLNGIFNFSGLIGDKISVALANTNDYFKSTIADYNGDKGAIISAIPADINGLLKQLVKVVIENNNVPLESDATIASYVGGSLGGIIMVIIAGVLVFIVLKILLALLSKLFDNIAKTKVLGVLNKVLGLVFGVIKAGLVIIVFNFILVGLSLIPAVNNTIKPLIQDNTHIEKVIYNQTDKFVGKHVIEGDMVQKWISSAWNNR